MRTLGLLAGFCALVHAEASAQPAASIRPTIEAVASVMTTSDHADDPYLFLDLAATWRLHEDVHVLVRPYARRLPGGAWNALLYGAQVRYQPVPSVRIEGGIISSPVGLGTLELRPDLNPTVGYPFYYFAPLPKFDEHDNRLQLLSGGYPLGAMVSWSEGKLDARAAITDGTPARYRNPLGNGPSAMPQLAAGGGVTPFPGLRVGAGFARGSYRRASDEHYFGASHDDEDGYLDSYEQHDDPSATVLNVEAEYAFGGTRLSGELVRDRFETEGAPAVARGYYVQAVQTLTPRVFGAARLAGSSSPALRAGGLTRWTRKVAELTAGYRLNPELTARIGYQVTLAPATPEWGHAIAASIVWAKRPF